MAMGRVQSRSCYKHVINRACFGQVLLLALLLVIWTDPGFSADRISQEDWA